MGPNCRNIPNKAKNDKVIQINSENNFIRTENKLIATIGGKD